MKLTTLSVLIALGFAAPALAQGLPSQAQAQRELTEARKAHVEALKANDKPAIAATGERLRHAYEIEFQIKAQAANNDKSLAKGDTYQAQHELELAQDAHADALLSGNKEEIDRTAKNLKEAYEHDYAARHAKHPG